MPSLASFTYEDLSNDDELRELEAQFDRYIESRAGFPSVVHFSLVEVRRALVNDPDVGRKFAALLDIRISMGLLQCDNIKLGKLANKAIHHLDGRAPLETVDAAFDLRMDIHAAANSFIFRFRSIWDKVMGLYVLTFRPDSYNAFCSARSRKRMFTTLMKGVPEIEALSAFAKHAEDVVGRFDDFFRTPEAHGTGRLRKHTFNWGSLEECRAFALTNYWNYANMTCHLIGGMFDPVARPRYTDSASSARDDGG